METCERAEAPAISARHEKHGLIDTIENSQPSDAVPHKPSRSICIPREEKDKNYSADDCISMPLSPADSENRMLHSILNQAATDTKAASGMGGHKVSALRAVVNPKRTRLSVSTTQTRSFSFGCTSPSSKARKGH
mmetsp:Transcript_17506/g.45561  ORF Transcript_17506/g.45561 Transcript_17506/m.45561 type:complete len:135 (+) Transcript_17506:163-567(+)